MAMTKLRETARNVHGTDLLIRRLQVITPLDRAEFDLLTSTQQRPRMHGAGSQINHDDDRGARLITSGWACRPRVLPDGRCQMLSILLPGDIVGDGRDQRPLALTPVVALTSVRTISLKPVFDAMLANSTQYRGLSAAMTQLGRIEESQVLDHVVRLGRQTAVQRVAHCLLEFYYRSLVIGFVHGGAFTMPLTQELLGDALGLSLVHVNRTLGQLRRDGLIELKAGLMTMVNVQRLCHVADFTPPVLRGRAAAPVERTMPVAEHAMHVSSR